MSTKNKVHQLLTQIKEMYKRSQVPPGEWPVFPTEENPVLTKEVSKMHKARKKKQFNRKKYSILFC